MVVRVEESLCEAREACAVAADSLESAEDSWSARPGVVGCIDVALSHVAESAGGSYPCDRKVREMRRVAVEALPPTCRTADAADSFGSSHVSFFGLDEPRR